jgi:hypothetical protein
LIFSTTFFWNISQTRYYHKRTYVLT